MASAKALAPAGGTSHPVRASIKTMGLMGEKYIEVLKKNSITYTVDDRGIIVVRADNFEDLDRKMREYNDWRNAKLKSEGVIVPSKEIGAVEGWAGRKKRYRAFHSGHFRSVLSLRFEQSFERMRAFKRDEIACIACR